MWWRTIGVSTSLHRARTGMHAQAEVHAANLLPLLERLAGEADPLLRRSYN